MPYREISGNLFASNAQALVNTVNCVGAMGKGVALEFRRRFPDMFKAYKEFCDQRKMKPGMILPYRTSEPWVLSFAVKDDWKHPSKIDWVEQCLKRFCEWYPEVRLKSVAFPWMGAMNGGIPIEDIQKLTRRYLGGRVRCYELAKLSEYAKLVSGWLFSFFHSPILGGIGGPATFLSVI